MGTLDFRAGETIFRQGDEGTTAFLIERGIVELRLGDLPLEQLQPGAFFGEMALLENLPRSASAIAITDVRLNEFDRPGFLDIVRSDPDFALNVLEVFAARLRRTNAALAAR